MKVREGRVKKAKFAVYDLEWKPSNLEIRIIGFYDGVFYTAFATIDEFLDYVLCSSYRGYRFYAHAGGSYDFLHLFYSLKSRGYELKVYFSGSSAAIVKVTLGHNCFTFVDSFYTLHAPLEEIFRHLGEAPKDYGGVDKKEFFESASLSLLISYNQRDCELLYEALRRTQEIVNGKGGELRFTMPASSLDIFLRNYLSHNLHINSYANAVSRESYFSSRVEVYTRAGANLNYYDVNSLFPYAMTFRLPGSYIGVCKKLPLAKFEYIADVELEVKDCYLPTVPLRTKQGTFFPTGSWRGWYTRPDLELLETSGCGTITKVHRALKYESFSDLAAFVRDFYAIKRDATGWMREIAKYIPNSLYGKTAERREKKSIVINPIDDDAELNWVAPGIYSKLETRNIDHEHVAIAAYVGAIGRAELYSWQSKSLERGKLYYSDTDSIVTTAMLETGKELGQLKLVDRGEGHFQAPKFYLFKGDLGTQIKAKGFSRLDESQYNLLVHGDQVFIDRMARLKEMINSNRFDVHDKVMPKGLSADSMPKRCFDEHGATRPWTCKELGFPT